MSELAAKPDGFKVYVGTRGSGRTYVHRLRFGSEFGCLRADGEPMEAVNPSFGVFHPNGHTLYVVNEVGKSRTDQAGSVSAFAIDKETGGLEFLNTLSTGGAAPCHVSVSANGRHLFVANYWGGSIVVFSLQFDGRLGARTAFVEHQGGARGSGRDPGPHAHSIRLDPVGRRVVVADLGRDELITYSYDEATGHLAPHEPAVFPLSRGAGPRHFVFACEGRRAFIVNELNSTIAVLAYDADSGIFNVLQSVSTRLRDAVGENTAAEIALSPDGRHLYASNRGDDTIVIYEVEGRVGTLGLAGCEPSYGRTPRHFALDRTGRHLIVANQGSNTVTVFARDPSHGRLTLAAPPYVVQSPVWIGVAP
jgi:6-phosphogluconolactonase